VFYYLVQDLKALVFSLISLHFKVWLLADTAVRSSLTLRRSSPSKYVSVAGSTGMYLWNDEYERKIE
jgi:protein mago nashi